MLYEKPDVVDLGSIARHTFTTHPDKGFDNLQGDFACELSHSGDSPVGHCDA
jgi:hypothetical protein